MNKVCKKCGIEKPATVEFFTKNKNCKNGIEGTCIECYKKRKSEEYKRRFQARTEEQIIERAKRQAEYQKNHKKELAIYKRKYCEVNKERIAADKKAYYEANKERHAAWRKAYWESHKEDLSARGRAYSKLHGKAYYEANKEAISAKVKIYHGKIRDKLRINEQRRRAGKKKLLSNLTAEQWQSIKNYFDNKCAYCGESRPLAQEHFYPLSKGGEYATTNIICACRRCNSSKGPKLFTKWYPEQEYYSKQREAKILKYLNYKNNIQQLSFV